jgi:tetratricopeptide (TPR) repeat protein
VLVRRTILAIVITFSASASGMAHCKQLTEAKRHLEHAIELDSFKDSIAEQEYRKAIELCNGRYPEAWRQLSWFLQRKSRFPESASTLQEYIRQTPREDHKDDRDELKELREAEIIQTRINTIEKPELSDLIKFCSLVSRYSENHVRDTIPFAERAISLYPTSSEALLLLARALDYSTQQDRVVNLIRQAVELAPNSPEAHYEMGRYYLWHSKLSRLDDSISEFRSALKLSEGKAVEAWQGLGRALILQEKTREGIEALRTYLRLKKPSQYDEEIKQLIRSLERSSR